ncbi:uncharacterized mitochondrial protein AtMg00820-like [Cryptomeria japonica]|uniref:uncharacterized mitochondrial protein AtMg00820-like n=1 Tax=Cryptomeria japonica TaxID=3369 RepID=UPI0027DA72FB|nr:uncharacterized mitochondrial protein AtMg00820-like [Cryptomeria japonica]
MDTSSSTLQSVPTSDDDDEYEDWEEAPDNSQKIMTTPDVDSDPIYFEDSIKEEKWCNAMDEEIDAIEMNDTWELTDFPPSKKVIGVKWVYKTKRNVRSRIERHKAILVVKGYKQQFEIDYDDTYALIARMKTV